ncbi:AAA family ATPase [Bernardetia sp.]|uniref:AAA family ATPase n=1 Tax=Bernardetia sp. TaxID=1937974 RepID=UPI0025BBE614|nr:AAA family ATPase [Bernardetia sp.]
MEKLIVKNFKAIEYAEIEVNDLTFFIGQQASGKSTLAKLVYFFKTLGKFIGNELLYQENTYDVSQIEKKIEHIIWVFFLALFGNNENFYINFVYANGNSIKFFASEEVGFTLQDDNDFLSKLSEELIQPIEELNSLRKTDTSFNDRIFKLWEDKIDRELNKYLPYKKDNIYFPAGRSFLSLVDKNIIEIGRGYREEFENYIRQAETGDSGSPLLYPTINENALLISSYINHCLDLKKTFKTLSNIIFQDKNLIEFVVKQEQILKGNYFQNNGEEGINTEKNKILLQNTSSGQQEAIRLLQDIKSLIIYNKKTAFRVYEEPEAHLFPASQKALMEMIVILLNSNPNVQLLISTHTPYLLAVLNTLMKAKKLEKQLGENDLTLDSLVPKEERLDSSRVRVYSAKQTENGRFVFENVVNQETQSIDAEIIDKVSEEIGTTYEQLLDLQSNLSNSVSE